MLIPRLWRQRRESRSYTDDRLADALAIAGGRDPDVARTAAAEYASSLVGRALAGAEVEADPITASLFPPAVLDQLGRSLVIRGEQFYDLQAGGAPRLIPATYRDCRGGADPASWVYDLDVLTPRGSRVIRRRAEAVLAFFWTLAPGGYRGQSPLDKAKHSAGLYASNEQKLAAEIANARVIRVLPTPFTGDDLEKFRKDLASGKDGQLTTSPTFGSGLGHGAANAPKSDYRVMRLGADPPASLTMLRDPAAMAVLAACGIQPAMWSAEDGRASREAWRQLYHTLQSVADIVAGEIAAKLGVPVRIRLPSEAYVDLQARARALRAMIEADVDRDDALQLCGFA